MHNKENVSTKTTFVIILSLIFLVTSVVLIRTTMIGENNLPTGDSAWNINLSVQVEAFEKNASIQIATPWDTLHARMYAQSLVHPDLRIKRLKESRKRDIMLAAAKSGKYNVEANFDIHISALQRNNLKKTKLSELDRNAYLSSSEDVQVKSKVTSAILEQFPSTDFTTDQLIEKLFNYVSNNVRIRRHGNIDSEVTLAKRRGSELGSNNALLALLRSAHLPARLVTGINLQDKTSSQPYHWVEVYENETWLPLDPVYGYMKQLPPFYVPLRKGGDALIEVEGGEVVKINWLINMVDMPNQYTEGNVSNTLDIFNFNRLSPTNRERLGLLLLLPLGIVATELLRQIGGVRTYGTFTPTLLALATIHGDHETTLIIFSLVIGIGIAARALLPNFDLDRTARLAIVFTLVAISMSLVTSGLIFFDPMVDSTVVLLPVVVLTMLVDRIYSVSDKQGIHTAMLRLFWTVLSALISLVILWQVGWSIWLVSYPEIHFLTLACIILIGLYQGPKLSELPAFYWIREPVKKVSSKSD